MSKKVLITGTSSGFGKLIANTLLDKGHTVIASMRGIDGKNKNVAEELKAKGAHVVEIDVTSDESVNQGVKKATDASGGLDVVVNNAGIGVLGMQEFFTPEDWKKLFEVNVFGIQRVNRAAIPQMRENGEGLLIHVSSLLGRFTLPFYGPYNASKWALEAMVENYRTELSGFGVESCLVEPGGYPTSFFDGLVKPSDTNREGSYGEFAKVSMQAFENFEKALASNPAQNPQDVADAVAELVDTPAGKRKFRTVVDKMGMGEHI
ncbi:MAG: SDR family oxidoreductase, partial [Eudoraea sp.]|nr:SDR family oxidoreductase [Eudoraea sp.]